MNDFPFFSFRLHLAKCQAHFRVRPVCQCNKLQCGQALSHHDNLIDRKGLASGEKYHAYRIYGLHLIDYDQIPVLDDDENCAFTRFLDEVAQNRPGKTS